MIIRLRSRCVLWQCMPPRQAWGRATNAAPVRAPCRCHPCLPTPHHPPRSDGLERVDVPADATVAGLKQAIEAAHGVPATSVRLSRDPGLVRQG